MNENEILKRLYLIEDELMNVKEEIDKQISYVQRQIIDLKYDIKEEQEKMLNDLANQNKEYMIIPCGSCSEEKQTECRDKKSECSVYKEITNKGEIK